MKIIFAILALAVFASSASAFGVNVGNLLANKKGGVIAQQDLQYIIQSQYNQYQLITTFFNQGNLDGKGQLTLQEFSKAYSSFIYFLIGQQIGAEFLYARFELADFASNTDTIDLAEFTFLIAMDLKLIYNNYCLFNGNLATLSASVAKIENMLNGVSFDSIFGAIFFGFDYDKDSQISPAEFRSGIRILGYIVGLNLSYTSAVLNDLFDLADVNKDMEVSQAEGSAFINAHLKDIMGVLNTIAGK